MPPRIGPPRFPQSLLRPSFGISTTFQPSRVLSTTLPRLQNPPNDSNNYPPPPPDDTSQPAPGSSNPSEPAAPSRPSWPSVLNQNTIGQALQQTISTYTSNLGYTPQTLPSSVTSQFGGSGGGFRRRGIGSGNGGFGGAPEPGTEPVGPDMDTEELYRLQRRFRQGEIYTPKDLSYESFKNVRRRRPPRLDAFDFLGINPLEEYKNFNLLGEYVTEMGRIKHRNDTGLRGVNQRKVAKAIRRAVGIGLLPSVHKHPELLKKTEAAFYNRQRPGRLGWMGRL